MRKILVAAALLLLVPQVVLAQSIPPHPDTAPTGSVPQMVQKLSQARSELDRVGLAIAENRRKLDAVNTAQAARTADAKKIADQGNKLIDDFKAKVTGFNAACAHRMREESVEFTDCLHSQTELSHEKDTVESQIAQLKQEFAAIKQEYAKDAEQQRLYQLTVQQLTGWKSEVEPEIRSLEAAIATKCKPLRNCPNS
jgi:chromosome segregation ATPase